MKLLKTIQIHKVSQKKIGPMEVEPERTEPAGKGWEQPLQAEPQRTEPARKD